MHHSSVLLVTALLLGAASGHDQPHGTLQQQQHNRRALAGMQRGKPPSETSRVHVAMALRATTATAAHQQQRSRPHGALLHGLDRFGQVHLNASSTATFQQHDLQTASTHPLAAGQQGQQHDAKSAALPSGRYVARNHSQGSQIAAAAAWRLRQVLIDHLLSHGSEKVRKGYVTTIMTTAFAVPLLLLLLLYKCSP